MGGLITRVTGAKLAEGFRKIYLPCEIENKTAQDRRINGIPISAPALNNLNKGAQELGVPSLARAGLS